MWWITCNKWDKLIMTRFTKTPLYKNKNKTMKKTYIILAFIIAGLLTYSAYNFHALQELKSTLISTTQAYEKAVEPTELESLTIELEQNRISRQEDQKNIDFYVESKKERAARADEIQDRIREITGLN